MQTEIVNPMLPLESRRTIDLIRSSLRHAARELNIAQSAAVALYERGGWRSVLQSDNTVRNYDKWSDCARTEFGKSMATVYRYLRTGQIRNSLTVEGEPTPQLAHTWAEELGRLPVPLRRQALAIAEQNTPADKKTTLREIRAACTALDEAWRTEGLVSVGDKQIALGAAITENMAEELKTKAQFVADHTVPTLASGYGIIRATVQPRRILIEVDQETAEEIARYIGREVQFHVKESEVAKELFT